MSNEGVQSFQKQKSIRLQDYIEANDSYKISSRAPQNRILLISDASMRRECLTHLLRERTSDLLVESVESVAEATQCPDIVLVDLKSANMEEDALESRATSLKQHFGDLPLVAVTDRDDYRFAAKVMRNGWRGCITTSLGADVVLAAIRLVMAGGTFIPRGLIDHYVDMRAEVQRAEPPADDSIRLGFTPREADVLTHLRQGKPNKLIAYALNISESTVKVHIRNMMRKLHATNRTQVAFLKEETATLRIGRAMR